MKDRMTANPGRVLITPEDGSAAFYATVTRADNPTQAGDPLSKITFLKDATAALYGLGADAVPDDVFSAIKQLLDSKSRIAIGSYIGTGVSGDSDPNWLNFDFEPSVLIILYKGLMTDASGYSYSMIATKTRTSVVVTWGADGSDTSGYRTTSANKFTFSGNQVSWYVEKDNPNWNNYYEAQFNEGGSTYHYIALG